MDQGLISNPKDLERMQHELDSLDRRITTLEDEELEVMEQLEEAQVPSTSCSGRWRSPTSGWACWSPNETGALRRSTRSSPASPPSAARWSRTFPATCSRSTTGCGRARAGSGAAELRARQCGGCRLTLDASEIAQIKAAPSDLVIRCEECQRILVRTSESGL